MYYGVSQPTIPAAAALGDTAQVQADLSAIRALHCTIVSQAFPINRTATHYKVWLDIAQDNGLKVIPTIGLAFQNPDPADLSYEIEIFQHIGTHPAVYAITIYDEPHRDLTLAQMQTIYTTLKAAAPTVRIAGFFSGFIDSGADFAAGIVDLAGGNILPYQLNASDALEDSYERIGLLAPVLSTYSTDLIVAPFIWPDSPAPRPTRAPTESEMTQLFLQLTQIYSVKVWLWYLWTTTPAGSTTINHAINLHLRNGIARIAEQYL